LQIPILTGVLTQALGTYSGLTTMASIGAVARLIESPAVRNILIKLPKVKAGSPQEAELLKRLDDIIIRESSTEREGEEIDDVLASDSPALQNLINNTDPSVLNGIQ